MEGKEFRKTKEALVAKQKELKKEGKGNKPNAARMPTDEEVDILYGQDLLGCSSSEALINTIWLNNKQFFWSITKDRRRQEQALIQKPKIFAVVGSERDPVRPYDLYASERPDDLKTPDSPFYLAIDHTTKAVNTKP